jgi:hypothetical protein
MAKVDRSGLCGWHTAPLGFCSLIWVAGWDAGLEDVERREPLHL